ncbi:MAG: fibronectin type 3 and ankyrin repeat domain protein 1 [Chthonomonadales bacterium]|nr:fibronectin type 3 and ankyrin repeat domain protein 1 [Chthonomonadales bacterium]
MKLRSYKSSAFLIVGLMLMLMTVAVVWTWRSWRQTTLNKALCVAVQKNDAEAVHALLHSGADANCFLPTSSSPTWSHLLSSLWQRKTETSSHRPAVLCVAVDTPGPANWHSHMPIWYPPDSAAVVQSLIQAGANVHVRNALGESPLLSAVRGRHSQKTVLVLLQAGADVNTQDRNGWTPLIWAIYESEPKTVQLLLANHADPKIGASDEYAGMLLRSLHSRR